MREYEKIIIGGIAGGIVAPSAVNLNGADFSDGDLGACLELAREMEAGGKLIDPEILALRLDSFWNADDFRMMARGAGSISVVMEAADKIKGASLKTFLLAKAAQIAVHEDKTGAELLDELRAVVDVADRSYKTAENNFVFVKDLIPKMKAVYEDFHAGRSYAVSSGFDKLDDAILDGFSRGDEHIIVAFTGQGKSALALNCAKNQASAGMCVGVVSREMAEIENVMRLQSSATGVERWKMRKGLTLTDFYTLNDNLEDLGRLPIAFDVRTTDVESLRPQVRKMVEVYDMKILYVDYLQLMTSSKNSSRAEEVAAVSRGLKLIAMENKIPVVSLCQFNRSAVTASVFDLLSFLKESSGIEQDASTIIYLQIEKTEEPKTMKDGLITILKNRNGAVFSKVPMTYRGEIFQFYEA